MYKIEAIQFDAREVVLLKILTQYVTHHIEGIDALKEYSWLMKEWDLTGTDEGQKFYNEFGRKCDLICMPDFVDIHGDCGGLSRG